MARTIPAAVVALLMAAASACGASPDSTGETAEGREQVVGGPCEGCLGVFVGLPDSLGSAGRLAPVDQPGAPLRIEGRVTDRENSPVPGVIVYAYHTDTGGIYPKDERHRGTEAYRHGRLRGWAKTAPSGRYAFDTIRPGGYPNGNEPAHIHMHVIEPGRCTYYIDDIHFADDPRLTEAHRERMGRGRGGAGLAVPRVDGQGVWTVTRDIVLGANVPGYDACGGQDPGE